MNCHPHRNLNQPIGPILTWIFLLLGVAPSAWGDRIILRSLKILSDRTVIAFDEEGVLLDNQQRLGWHEIERAAIAQEKQAAFDKLVAELGEPLYRIRQRLTTADYEGLLQPAEALYPRYADRASETAYVVTQAVMWGRIAAGRRETALEPYLHCYEMLRKNKALADGLPGNRRLQMDAATGLTPELTPIWFDADAARSALPGVFRQISAMRRPRPDGASIYYATLALAAGDDAAASKVLAAIQSTHPAILELQSIVAAQREVISQQPGEAVAKLKNSVNQIKPEHQPLAWYWLGLSLVKDGAGDPSQAGLLQLLRVPALAGRQQPELAGAALFHAMEAFAAQGKDSERLALRRELLERYGQTYYAGRVRGAPNHTEKKL